MIKKDRIAAREAFGKLTTSQKIAHLWHYYKWQAIITLAILTLAGNFIYTCATRVDPDLTILWLSQEWITDEQIEQFELEFAAHIEDANCGGCEQAIVEIRGMFYDPHGGEEMTFALNQRLELDIIGGNAKLFIVDEVFFEMVRSFDIIEDYAPITNMPVDIGTTPLFAIERVEYQHHMRGRAGVRRAVEHQNARAIFELLTD